MNAYFRRRESGFSLLELLVVLSVIVVLLVIAFPIASRVRALAQNTQCVSNLKSVSAGLLAFAAEHDGRTPTAYSTNAAQTVVTGYWHMTLADGKYITRGVLACPAHPPKRFPDSGFTMSAYGLRRISTPWDRRFEPAFDVRKVTTPSRYLLVADSYAPANGSQIYFIDYAGFAEGHKIHARHNGHANIAFADGHVESLTKDEILNVGDGWNANGIHVQ